MIDYNLLLEMPLFAGLVFLLTGVIMLLFPPKKPNMFYGYRTTRSMNSQEAWQFAQKYAAIKMLQAGGIFLFFSIVGNWYSFPEIGPTVFGICLLILATVYILVSTELALKSEFPNKKL